MTKDRHYYRRKRDKIRNQIIEDKLLMLGRLEELKNDTVFMKMLKWLKRN